MRKVILAMTVSLDGYIARENGDTSWIPMPDDMDEIDNFFSSVDTILWGRKAYEKDVEPGGGYMLGRMSYVFSRTPRESEREDLKFISGNVKKFVEDLKQRDGKNIWLAGGGQLATSFFEMGLIDELILGIRATILGQGIPLFSPHDRPSNLELIDVYTRISKTVELHYRVK